LIRPTLDNKEITMFHEPSFHRTPIAVGIDVGYSAVKFAYSQDGKINTDSFPSVATPQVPGTCVGTVLDIVGVRDTDLQVTVEGITYAVDTNPDALVGGGVIRSEIDSFPLSNEYSALVYAALARCRATQVDQLVLGLPFHTFNQLAEKLVRKFKGVHNFGHGAVNIQRVAVLPQPMGSYAYLNATQAGSIPRDTFGCIVDIGWGTSDVVVSSPGFRIDRQRSGGLSGGAAIVLRAIADSLRAKYGDRFNNLDRIDRCIVTGRPLTYKGVEIDLLELLEEARRATYPIVRSLLTTLKTTDDLTVIAAGGAAHYYLPALTTILGQEIKTVDQPRFANAMGFLLAGQAALKANK
jgi:plasmid segregation protein ParM